MDLQFDYILLQMLMVLFPIILYQALLADRASKKAQPYYWGLVFAVTMGLCIVFALKLEDGVFLDLRMVPWFLAFLYGGKAVGICVTLFYIIVRFLVGGTGMVPAYIVLILSTAVIWRMHNRFTNYEPKKKILVSIFFLVISSTMIPITGTLVLNQPVNTNRIIIYLIFILINSLTVWLAVHLVEMYKEKQELVKEVRRQEKMHVAGQVAASVAHEIRNPMTSVRGFIQLLEGSKNLNESEKTYLRICRDELDRANKIISDYLSLGKTQDIEKLSVVDLSNLAAKSVNTLYSYATLHNVRVELNPCKGAQIMGVPSRIQQMFINLIKNAIEAASPEGNVELEIEISDEKVVLTISDDGIGMTAEQVENLGLPYYSTKEKGTGLGLMVTLQIIKEMGGSWKVISERKKGTQITIHFALVGEN